jgi:hypothetical protein
MYRGSLLTPHAPGEIEECHTIAAVDADIRNQTSQNTIGICSHFIWKFSAHKIDGSGLYIVTITRKVWASFLYICMLKHVGTNEELI